MAVIVPILAQFDGRGIKSAIGEFKRAESAADRVAVASRRMQVAFGAALVAGGALAVKLGVDGVKAAMDEEAAISKLNKTLENVGQGASADGVQKFIDDLQYATGVSDDQLRPAFERLIRSTGDVAEAQRALGMATDIAAGRGKDLLQVANSLGKMYDGNTQALGRLGLGLSETTLKSGDVKAITSEISTLFAGQASTAADTFAGKIKVLQIGFSELQESFGVGFIKSFTEGTDGAAVSAEQLTSDLRGMQTSAEQFGTALGNVVKGISFGFQVLRGSIVIIVNEMMNAADLYQRLAININDFLNIITDQEAEHQRALLDSGFAARETAKYEELLGYKFAEAGNAAAGAVPQIDSFTSAAYGAAGAATAIYTGGTPTGAYNGINAMGNMSARVKALKKALDAAAEAAKKHGSSTAGAAAEADKASPKWERLTKVIEGNKKSYDDLAQKLEQAKEKMASYSAGIKDALLGNLDLGGAIQQQIDRAFTEADLNRTIVEAWAKGDYEAAVNAEMEKAGLGAAMSWVDAFELQIADTKNAAEAIKRLQATLNPADSLGNQKLIDSLFKLSPEQAVLAAEDMIQKGIGPKLAAELSSLDIFAGGVGEQFAKTFEQPGVDAAQANVDAIKRTLEANLDALYKEGQKLGKSVKAGYDSIVNSLPNGVRVPKLNSGGQTGLGAAPAVHINITSGIGNPVQIAKEIRQVLNSSQIRLGV